MFWARKWAYIKERPWSCPRKLTVHGTDGHIDSTHCGPGLQDAPWGQRKSPGSRAQSGVRWGVHLQVFRMEVQVSQREGAFWEE